MAKRERKFEYYKDLFGKAFTATFVIGGATISGLKSDGLTFWSGLGVIVSIISIVATFLVGKNYKRLSEENNG